MPAHEPTSPPPHPTQVRLQILNTEHWSLLASRALAWNEVFSRASMFLSTLSFAVVALALVGQASGFGEEFRVFALVVLPVVLFLGLVTSMRMDSANNHDARCVIGMNRIRAGYLELEPDLERFFVMGATDDIEGIGRTMGVLPGRPTAASILVATPTLIAVLDAVVIGAIGALAVLQLGGGPPAAIVVGGLGFVAAFVTWAVLTRRQVAATMAQHQPRFPSGNAPSEAPSNQVQPHDQQPGGDR